MSETRPHDLGRVLVVELGADRGGLGLVLGAGVAEMGQRQRAGLGRGQRAVALLAVTPGGPAVLQVDLEHPGAWRAVRLGEVERAGAGRRGASRMTAATSGGVARPARCRRRARRWSPPVERSAGRRPGARRPGRSAAAPSTLSGAFGGSPIRWRRWLPTATSDSTASSGRGGGVVRREVQPLAVPAPGHAVRFDSTGTFAL